MITMELVTGDIVKYAFEGYEFIINQEGYNMDINGAQSLQRGINGDNRQGSGSVPVNTTPSRWLRYLKAGLVTVPVVLGGVACGVGAATGFIAVTGLTGYISYREARRKLAERQTRSLSEAAEQSLPVNPDGMVFVDVDSTDSSTSFASNSTGGEVSGMASCQFITAKKRKASVSSDALHPPCSKRGKAINTAFPVIKEQLYQSSISGELKESIKSAFYAFNALTQHEKNKFLERWFGNVVYVLPAFPDWVIRMKSSERYLSKVNHLRPFVSQSQHLHISDMIALDSFHVLEEKLPETKKMQLTDDYIMHKDEFTPAVREITDMVCQGVIIGKIIENVPRIRQIMSYDRLPPLIYNRADGTTEYKIGFVNIDCFTVYEDFKAQAHTKLPIKGAFGIRGLPRIYPLQSIMDLVTLYPLHIDEILAVTKKHFILSELEERSIRDKGEWQEMYLDTIIPMLQYYEFRRKPQYDEFLIGKEGSPEQIQLTLKHQHELKSMSSHQRQAINELLKLINGAIILKNQESLKSGEDNRAKAREIRLIDPMSPVFIELMAQNMKKIYQKQSSENKKVAIACKRQARHSPYPLRTKGGRSSKTSSTTSPVKIVPLQSEDFIRIGYEYFNSLLIDSCDFLQERNYIYMMRDLRKDVNTHKKMNSTANLHNFHILV